MILKQRFRRKRSAPYSNDRKWTTSTPSSAPSKRKKDSWKL